MLEFIMKIQNISYLCIIYNNVYYLLYFDYLGDIKGGFLSQDYDLIIKSNHKVKLTQTILNNVNYLSNIKYTINTSYVN